MSPGGIALATGAHHEDLDRRRLRPRRLRRPLRAGLLPGGGRRRRRRRRHHEQRGGLRRLRLRRGGDRREGDGRGEGDLVAALLHDRRPHRLQRQQPRGPTRDDEREDERRRRRPREGHVPREAAGRVAEGQDDPPQVPGHGAEARRLRGSVGVRRQIRRALRKGRVRQGHVLARLPAEGPRLHPRPRRRDEREREGVAPQGRHHRQVPRIQRGLEGRRAQGRRDLRRRSRGRSAPRRRARRSPKTSPSRARSPGPPGRRGPSW